MNLQSSIVELKGIGPKSAEKFHKLDIYTIEDLLLYYPFRYEDFKSKSVLDLVDGEKAVITGTVVTQLMYNIMVINVTVCPLKFDKARLLLRYHFSTNLIFLTR